MGTHNHIYVLAIIYMQTNASLVDFVQYVPILFWESKTSVQREIVDVQKGCDAKFWSMMKLQEF